MDNFVTVCFIGSYVLSEKMTLTEKFIVVRHCILLLYDYNSEVVRNSIV